LWDVHPLRSCRGRAGGPLHAGEIVGPRAEVLRAHADTCPRCNATWAELDRERAEVEQGMPFAHFAAGVRGRLPRARAEVVQVHRRTPTWVARVVPLAAAASVAIVTGVVLLRAPVDPHTERIKGSPAELIVGGSGTTRGAIDGEQLAPGERVRIKVTPDPRQRFGLALSVDAAGKVEPLYDADGRSLSLQPGEAQVLPDSLEFTGSGPERVYVILSEDPLRTDDVARRAQDLFHRAGSVERMGPLPGVPEDEQVTTLLRKP
jgi:hypothetical protein